MHLSARQPVTGVTPLANGEVATDLVRYHADSEQTPAAVGLGVAPDDLRYLADERSRSSTGSA